MGRTIKITGKILYYVFILFIVFLFFKVVNKVEEDEICHKEEIQRLTEMVKELESENVELYTINKELNKTIVNLEESYLTKLEIIEEVKDYDAELYLTLYKKAMNIDITQYISCEDFELLARVVEAEIGCGDFDQKVNVASCIINRYFAEVFPDDWNELLTQDNQFETISNGSYLRVEVTQETRNAIEYAFLIENTAQGCTYFRSGEKDTWHDRSENLEIVFSDGLHNFYRLKDDGE